MNVCAEIVAGVGKFALSLSGPPLASLLGASSIGPTSFDPGAVRAWAHSPLGALGGGFPGGGFPLAAVRVDVDRTVLLAFVVFIALIVILKPLIFDPMMRVFELREQRTEGVRAEARAMQERAGELLRRYERELEKVNKVAAEERERLRQDTAKLEAQILAEARAEAARIVDEGRRAIAAEIATARRDLDASVPALARELASTVLGRDVSGGEARS